MERKTDTQTDQLTIRQTYRLTDQKKDRLTDRPLSRTIDRQTDRTNNRETDKMTDRQQLASIVKDREGKKEGKYNPTNIPVPSSMCLSPAVSKEGLTPVGSGKPALVSKHFIVKSGASGRDLCSQPTLIEQYVC